MKYNKIRKHYFKKIYIISRELKLINNKEVILLNNNFRFCIFSFYLLNNETDLSAVNSTELILLNSVAI